jgi:uncharacterized protein (TIGR03435 family)
MLACGLLLTSLASPYRAESQDAGKAAPVPARGEAHFEVASIHESGKDSGNGFWSTADTVRLRGQSVFGLILQAYFPLPIWSPDRIRNCNDPVCHQEYDVVGKIAAEDLPRMKGVEERELTQTMLQNLLADRFKLRLHAVPAEIPGFALAVGKKGARLTPPPKDDTAPEKAMRLSHGGYALHLSNQGDKVWAFHGATIASLIDFLQIGAHALIEDRTGLNDRYDFVLSRNADASNVDYGGTKSPDILWNLDLLGLHIDPVKVQTSTLIIDHLEKPSPN